METKIYTPTQYNLDLCADLIKRGEVVAFPTETVYGLGANALDSESVKKIYSAKGRPSDNPLIVHIADKNDITKLAKDIPPLAEKVVEQLMPGPITIVLNKLPAVPDTVTGGLNTVAIRMPSSEIALALIRKSGCPICAPSANTSGKPSPTTAK
ncbi:MAG: threonylcarbamoyl-AMP synthase, partial [Clostridia bacterium]|nr:threonylcarbamoyl-AMP synthase [Clostridia bacterium]